MKERPPFLLLSRFLQPLGQSFLLPSSFLHAAAEMFLLPSKPLVAPHVGTAFKCGRFTPELFCVKFGCAHSNTPGQITNLGPSRASVSVPISVLVEADGQKARSKPHRQQLGRRSRHGRRSPGQRSHVQTQRLLSPTKMLYSFRSPAPEYRDGQVPHCSRTQYKATQYEAVPVVQCEACRGAAWGGNPQTERRACV